MRDVLERHVRDGTLPGAVALVARGDDVRVDAVGWVDVERTAPMARDSIFRIASISKPITAAAVMMLVEDGVVGLDAPVAEWLPELASPLVVRTPDSPVDDVVPVERPITVLDLLTGTAGYGFPSDFSLPQVQALFTVQSDGRAVQAKPAPDEWVAALAGIPLLYQPGQAWLYDTCSDLQGVLIARASGAFLQDFLAERMFEPLGMVDTGFEVPAAQRARMTSYYRIGDHGLELADGPAGQWSTMPAFPSGAGGLASTADDWLCFARMLLGGGVLSGRRLLDAESVRMIMTDHLTPAQRSVGELFLAGQGWGFGGCVDVEAIEPWNVAGRYGWVGGTGTSAHVVPSAGAVTILLTQVGLDSPVVPAYLSDFWRAASLDER